jgi:hypothetical protein
VALVSARGELYRRAMQGKDHSPRNSELVSGAMDAYRAEVLNEAADIVTAEANERDRILGSRLEVSATERAVAARLRRMAQEAS